MDDIQKQLEELNRTVDTARQEIELAIMFHETWRPTAYDTELHDRIGNSYAAHSFQIIRLSLRRELLLALMRVWDSNKQAVRMSLIATRLRERSFFDALVKSRTKGLRMISTFAEEAVRRELTPKRDKVLELIKKYSEGENGEAFEVLKKLKTLRNEHLAHRQLPNAPETLVRPSAPEQPSEGSEPVVWATDEEVETFYQDNLEIVGLLSSLVQGVGFDLSEAASVYKHHSKFFWASARGERTEGHPNYRAPVM